MLLKEASEFIWCAGHEAMNLSYHKFKIKENLCSKNSCMLELFGKGSTILLCFQEQAR